MLDLILSAVPTPMGNILKTGPEYDQKGSGMASIHRNSERCQSEHF